MSILFTCDVSFVEDPLLVSFSLFVCFNFVFVVFSFL